MLKLTLSKYWHKPAFCNVCGIVIGKDSEGNQIQEHLETIYYIGYLRITIFHKLKFMKYT